MNSLKIKILGLAIFILGSAVLLTAWQNLRTQKAVIAEVASQNGQILGETVSTIIIANMANGQKAEVGRIFERIGRKSPIENIRIFDETGRILISAKSEEIGDLIPAGDLLAYRSDHTRGARRDLDKGYFGTTVPIHNAPPCYGCHPPDKQVLGILDIQYSLSSLSAIQIKGRNVTFFSSVGALALLAITLAGFFFYYVDTPIRRLIEAMNRLEQGDFDGGGPRIDSSTEMALLSRKFGTMVDQLRRLMQATVQQEREMAIAQEKLCNHDEIREMNTTLEERLNEIEVLNITLEERIEEIEEANYKISGLASDLEGKNKNLAQAVTRLSALYKMGLALNSTMELDKVFDLLLRKTVEALNAKIGYILLLDRDNWSLKMGAAIGLPEGAESVKGIPLRPGGVSHWVVENEEPLLIKDIEQTKGFSRISRLGYARETMLCAPLTTKEGVIGTLTMANRRDTASFTTDDLELLSTIAAQASIAIRNARLYDEQQSTCLSTVQALVSTIEASDAYTRGHSERVTRYSLLLAHHLGLAPESIKKLEEAAVLHDIGKIGIDPEILNKKECLLRQDIDMLRQHPSIGVHILEPIHFLKDVREIIHQHHERYDGNGYPHGLAGEAILPEARILAIADAYDAMTSDRPYRKALSLEIAIQEIRENSGTQFDPTVVEAFLMICEKFGMDAGERLAG